MSCYHLTRFRSHILLFLGLLCMHFMLPAQSSLSMHISPGLQYAAQRDYGISPLMYTGLQSYISTSLEVEKSHKYDLVEIGFLAGSLRNRYDTYHDARSFHVNTYTFYHAKKDAASGFQIGWSNHNVFTVRDSEFASNFSNRFDYYTSFGPAARYLKPIDMFGRQLVFEAVSHLQLLGFVMQSAYVSQAPKGYEEENRHGIDVFLNSIEWFIPGRAWATGFWTSLTYGLGTGNALSLNYRYDYSCLRGAHMVRKSQGTWFVTIKIGL